MASSLALMLDYECSTPTFDDQICVVDYDTKWIDVYALVKCYLDISGDIEIKYLDDENDQISLSSEDEYSLAKQLARQCGDTLRLKVNKVCTNMPDAPVRKVTAPRSAEPGSRYDSVTGSILASADELVRYRGKGGNQLAHISVSKATMEDCSTTPLDEFINTVVLDILQGLDGSDVIEGDSEDARATRKKIRQGIREKERPSMIEWSQGSVRVSKLASIPSSEFVDKVVQGVMAGLDGAELRTAMIAKDKSESQLHPRVVCDECNRKIYGTRYKCGHCPNFDLCESCEPGSTHDRSHILLKIKKPAVRDLGRQPCGQMKPLLGIPVYPEDKSTLEQGKEIQSPTNPKVRQGEWEEPNDQPHPPLPPVKRQRVEGAQSKKEIPEKKPVPCQDQGLILQSRSAVFLADVNFTKGTRFQPGTKFTKLWQIRNTGQVPLCTDGYVKFLWGNIPNTVKTSPSQADKPILPNASGVVSVDCQAPMRPGVYQGTWRLVDFAGREFGDRLTCEIIVDEPEILEPTEQEQQPSLITEQIICVQKEDTLEASDAVANLQSDQSDSSAPNKIISNNTELLTAHDILSFEMLKISKEEALECNADDEDDDNDVEEEVKGLATPNNTPCGMTPCMSPVPQLDPESLSRKMSNHEDMVDEREEETENGAQLESSSSNEELVIVDLTADCDSSSDSDSDGESLLDDFYVVPLPDCFDLEKPLEECLLSAIIAHEDSQSEEEGERDDQPTPDNPQEPSASLLTQVHPQEQAAPLTSPPEEEVPVESTTADVDTLLATSHTLVQVPLVPLFAATTIQPPDEIVPHTIITPSSHSGTYSAPEIVLDASEVDDLVCGLLVSPDEEAVFPEGQCLVRQVPEEEIICQQQQQLPVEEPPCVRETSTTHSSFRETDADGCIFHDAEDQRGDHTPQEEGDTIHREGEASHDDGVQTEGAEMYRLPESQDQAREILGYTASRAVSVASSVMRQAYDVANNVATALLVPPPQPMPMPEGTASESTSQTPMDTLIEMGFGNREKNRTLLYKYNNDVNQCVQELLSEEVDNWHLSRH